LPLSTGNGGDEDEAPSQCSSDLPDISRTKSLDVLVPPGKSLRDVFVATSPMSETGAPVEFVEPLEMGGKLRWQIVRVLSEAAGCDGRNSSSLLESRESHRPVSQLKDIVRSPSQAKEESVESKEPRDSEEKESDIKEEEKSQESAVQEDGEKPQGPKDLKSEESRTRQSVVETPEENAGKEGDSMTHQHEQTELAYRAMYLPSGATLKDLRNMFVESEQLDKKNGLHFQFLLSDVPGDKIELDTEDEVLLSQIESRLVQKRTLYIETIDPSEYTT
jgi:hypothetical protein